MRKPIEDQTKAITPNASVFLTKMAATLKWKIPDRERKERVALLAEMIETFRRVPLRSRQLFAFIVERAEWIDHQDCSVVAHNEIREACGLSNAKLFEHVAVLKKYKLVEADYDEFSNPGISIRRLWGGKYHSTYGWTFWEDLTMFCEESGIPLADLIVNLRFNMLD